MVKEYEDLAYYPIKKNISPAVLLTETSSTTSLTFDNIYLNEAFFKADKIKNRVSIDNYCCTEFNNSVVDYFKNNTFYQDSIRDALRRYKLINGKNYQFSKQANLFFDILYNVVPFAEPTLYLDDNSLTADFMFNNIKYTLKNDFECPQSVFLSHFKKVKNRKRLNIAEYDVYDYASIRDAINK